MVMSHSPPHASGMRRSHTLNPMLPVWPPGFVAVTVAGPSLTPAGTMNVALCPLAGTTWAGTPPTAMATFLAPTPWPVMVTCAPTLAHDGDMLLICPAWGAGSGWARAGSAGTQASAVAASTTARHWKTGRTGDQRELFMASSFLYRACPPRCCTDWPIKDP